MSYRVLLVDGQKILREGISAILSRTSEFEVVGEAENGLAALRLINLSRPDLVLMEIGLPGLNGVETTLEILRWNPDCRIVILSDHADDCSALSSIQAGARGFILKDSSQAELLSAMHTVAAGGMHICPQISDRLILRIQRKGVSFAEAPSAIAALSGRELQVLRLVAEGKSSKEIATVLDLSEQTVRSYRKSLMRKLHVSNAVTLSQVAYSTGLAQVPRDESRAASARIA